MSETSRTNTFMASLYPIARTIMLAQTVSAGMLINLVYVQHGPFNNKRTHFLNRKLRIFLIMLL